MKNTNIITNINQEDVRETVRRNHDSDYAGMYNITKTRTKWFIYNNFGGQIATYDIEQKTIIMYI